MDYLDTRKQAELYSQQTQEQDREDRESEVYDPSCDGSKTKRIFSYWRGDLVFSDNLAMLKTISLPNFGEVELTDPKQHPILKDEYSYKCSLGEVTICNLFVTLYRC